MYLLEHDAKELLARYGIAVPPGRLVDPEAIGNIIAMLCLPLSRDINGAAVTIDGGTSA